MGHPAFSPLTLKPGSRGRGQLHHLPDSVLGPSLRECTCVLGHDASGAENAPLLGREA